MNGGDTGEWNDGYVSVWMVNMGTHMNEAEKWNGESYLLTYMFL